jgi:hypothetical protein
MSWTMGFAVLATTLLFALIFSLGALLTDDPFYKIALGLGTVGSLLLALWLKVRSDKNQSQ